MGVESGLIGSFGVCVHVVDCVFFNALALVSDSLFGKSSLSKAVSEFIYKNLMINCYYSLI